MASARFVIISSIIKGLTIEEIVSEVRERAAVDKEDSAIKKDITHYRSFAKKEKLIDDEGYATQEGKSWVANGGKKLVAPEVQERQQKAAAQRKKKAEAKRMAQRRLARSKHRKLWEEQGW